MYNSSMYEYSFLIAYIIATNPYITYKCANILFKTSTKTINLISNNRFIAMKKFK